ncbi:MAG TPA: PIN domain-containing protein [Candidatus Limnocylindrales bacterium]|nr:PIN domain-containing protein [Candidatus Limnocylindrales bacterium]
MELADTSVWAHKSHAPIREWFAAAVEAGDVACCDMVALELLHSARNPHDFALIEMGLAALPWVEPSAADWRRAREVYRALGGRPGQAQRGVKHADLLIAAAAERAGLTLAHYDSDYDTIASVTGQSMRWVVPRGSL